MLRRPCLPSRRMARTRQWAPSTPENVRFSYRTFRSGSHGSRRTIGVHLDPAFRGEALTRELALGTQQSSPFFIDAPDVATAEHGEINVVLRVRNDVIDIRPGDTERLKHFELAGFFVE